MGIVRDVVVPVTCVIIGAFISWYILAAERVINDQTRAEEALDREIRLYAAEWRELYPVRRQAALFLDTGQNGSLDNVFQVRTHLGNLNNRVVQDRIRIGDVREHYRGPLEGWSARFLQEPLCERPECEAVTASQQESFVFLGRRLAAISELYSPQSTMAEDRVSAEQSDEVAEWEEAAEDAMAEGEEAAEDAM